MSFKAVIIVVGLASAATAVVKSQEAAPTDEATSQVSTGATESGELSLGGKIKRSFGSLGVKIVGNTVTGSVEKTNLMLKELAPALKKKAGPDGKRARDAAKKVMYYDSIALASLEEKHPVLAINMAMKGRDFLSVAKTNLANP